MVFVALHPGNVCRKLPCRLRRVPSRVFHVTFGMKVAKDAGR